MGQVVVCVIPTSIFIHLFCKLSLLTKFLEEPFYFIRVKLNVFVVVAKHKRWKSCSDINYLNMNINMFIWALKFEQSHKIKKYKIQIQLQLKLL